MKMVPGQNKDELTESELESGKKYSARLVVGSDGMNSFTRETHGISTWGYDYHQKGVVCTLSTLEPLSGAF